MAIKLVREHLTAQDGGVTLGLREAKELVDNFGNGIPFPKMWLLQPINSDFRSMFSFDEMDKLKLFKIQVSPVNDLAKRYKVIVLSIDEINAKAYACKCGTRECGLVCTVRTVDEITEFAPNTMIACFEIS